MKKETKNKINKNKNVEEKEKITGEKLIEHKESKTNVENSKKEIVEKHSETIDDQETESPKRKHKKENKFLKLLNKTSASTKVIIVLAIIVIVLLCIVMGITKKDEPKFTITAKSSLEKILEISELSTVEYTYNSVACKKNKKGKVEYYVAYKGKVTAGIDFKEIKIDIDEDKKNINITLPEVTIQEYRVMAEDLEFIFAKKDDEKDKNISSAIEISKKDLESKVKDNDEIHESARENSITAVEGLLKPWIETVDEEYKVEIK